jgi:hypothetical protein
VLPTGTKKRARALNNVPEQALLCKGSEEQPITLSDNNNDNKKK